MSKKKKENPDLTQEFRNEQEFYKKQKKKAQTPPPQGYQQQPYYPNQNGYYNGYNQGYPQQNPYQQQVPPPQYVPPTNNQPQYSQNQHFEEKKVVEEEKVEANTEYIEVEEIKKRKHKKKSRVKEYGKKEVDDVEKQYHSKQRRKYFLRGVLIILNFALLAYLCLNVVDLIFDLNRTANVTPDSYITLCGQSRKQSEEIYESVLNDKEPVLINDYAIYGDDLYLSSNRITASNTSTLSDLYVRNVCSGEADYFLQEDKIDIANFEDGDYVVATGVSSERNHLKYSGSHSVLYTYYTLPKDGLRKKITIKNNKVSPMLVISLETIEDLPEFSYDIVYYVEEENKSIVPNIEGYTYKVIYTKDGYDDAYLTSSSYAFDLTGDSYLSSYFDLNYEGFTKDNLDSTRQTNPFIREIGGYITGANSCLDASSCVLNPYYKTEHIGKKSYVLNGKDTAENIKAHIETILNNN